METSTFLRGDDDECAACGACPDVLYGSGEAAAVLLCDACMVTARAEHERRCSFCGYHAAYPHRHRPVAWQDVAGRSVCDGVCADLERARQAAEPVELVHCEVDGWWGFRTDGVYMGPSRSQEDLLWSMMW